MIAALAAESTTEMNVRFGPLCGHKSDISRGPRGARSRRNRALCSARKMSCHFARLNTNSSVTPAGVRGFVIFNSSSVIDVTIRR